MSEFQREERYIVLKIKDLTLDQTCDLRDYIAEQGIKTVGCVVVENDWPNYEHVWQTVEQVANGTWQAARAQQAGSGEAAAERIVNDLFAVGDEPRSPVYRIQFMGGDAHKEKGQGGFDREALTRWLAGKLEQLSQPQPAQQGADASLRVSVNSLIESARCFATSDSQESVDHWSEKVGFYRDRIYSMAQQGSVPEGWRLKHSHGIWEVVNPIGKPVSVPAELWGFFDLAFTTHTPQPADDGRLQALKEAGDLLNEHFIEWEADTGKWDEFRWNDRVSLWLAKYGPNPAEQERE